MADMTLLQAIAFLEGLPQKIGEQGREVMRQEFGSGRPYSKGDRTYKSFTYEVMGNLIFIGSSTEGAYWVQKGRSESVAKNAKWLHWESPTGKDVFAKRSPAVRPDDYIGRTARRLESMDFH